MDAIRRGSATEALLNIRRQVFTDQFSLLANRSIELFFKTARVEPGSPVWGLPSRRVALDFRYSYGGWIYEPLEVVRNTFTDGLLVIKDGAIVLECYDNLAHEQTHFLSFSMGKTINALIIGAAIEDGFIQSVTDPIERYLPAYAGTDWAGTTIRNLLQFRSGMDWDDYPYKPGAAKESHERSFIRNEGHYHDPAPGLKRIHPAGTVFNYSSLETSLLGALVESAVGRRLNTYFGERLWKPAGMEGYAFWVLDGDPEQGGREISGGTFNAVLRDYGRLGLLMANEGVANGRRILPMEWIRECATPGSPESIQMNPGYNYGYQLWTMDGGTGYAGIGSGGQFLFVDPATKTVVVKMSHAPQAYPDFKPSADETREFLLAVSAWSPD